MCAIRDWIIELDGVPVGRLINGQWADMFWDDYEVDATAEFTEIVHDPTNWLSFHFRDPETGETVTDAVPSADYAETLSDSRIGMRGLYLESDIESPSRLGIFLKNVDGAVYAILVFGLAIAISYALQVFLGY